MQILDPRRRGGAGENVKVGVGMRLGGAMMPTFSARCTLEGWPSWRLPVLAQKPVLAWWPGSRGWGLLAHPHHPCLALPIKQCSGYLPLLLTRSCCYKVQAEVASRSQHWNMATFSFDLCFFSSTISTVASSHYCKAQSHDHGPSFNKCC